MKLFDDVETGITDAVKFLDRVLQFTESAFGTPLPGVANALTQVQQSVGKATVVVKGQPQSLVMTSTVWQQIVAYVSEMKKLMKDKPLEAIAEFLSQVAIPIVLNVSPTMPAYVTLGLDVLMLLLPLV